MHQDNIIILQGLSCTVDGIDIVRFCVQGVVDEGELQGQVQFVAVVNKHLIVIARCHYDFLNTKRHQLTELTAQDSILERDLRHALRVFLSKYTHAVTKTAV